MAHLNKHQRSTTNTCLRYPLVAALLLAGLMSSGHAQFAGRGGGMARGSGTHAPAERVGTRWEQLSSKLYDLRIQLLIERDQGPAFEKFRTSFLDLALLAAATGASTNDGQGVLQALQQQLDATARRLVNLQHLQDDTQALLAMLNPQQAAIAGQTLPALLTELGGRAGGTPGPR